jgi:hypothetical protein
VSFVASRTAKVATPAAQGERYEPAIGFVITGVMAAGKSTVADALAQRFQRGVHVRGDVFRKMIVRGRDPITPELGDEALRQLDLRQRIAANVANEYWRDDFTVVLQDIYAGDGLANVVGRLEISPLYVVVLTLGPTWWPHEKHDARSPATASGTWHSSAVLRSRDAAHRPLARHVRDLAEESVEEILLGRHDARVR